MAKDTEAEREEGETRCCVSTWLYYFEYILSIIGMFLLLVAAIALVIFWCIFYRKGYNTWKSEKEAQFNLHPTLMVFGICFNAFAIVLYRLGRCSCKLYIKLLHGFFNLLALACYLVGLFAIFEYHQMNDTAHFMSLHSWVGLATLGLLLTQFFFGFKTYILLMCCERATTCYRTCMTPLHTAFGFTIFMLAIATAISGLVQKSIISLGEGAILSEKPEEMQEQAVLNCLGVTLVCLAVVVTYIIARRRCRVTSDTFVSERL